MKPAVKISLRIVGALLALVLVVALAGGLWFYTRLRAGLPQLDGASAIAGLSAPVSIERDALGVPTIRGASRADVARALGFLHAQERFFQMDLMRRRGAGELAELFGAGALPLDKTTRIHGFRALSRSLLTRLTADERGLLEAYATGVNTGLGALGAKPFEYIVLRAAPQTWLPEDSILVAYSMVLELEDDRGSYEKTVSTLRDTLGKDALAFFAPLVVPSDAAIDGSTAPLAPIPAPSVLDLRPRKPAAELSTADAPTPRLAPLPFDLEREAFAPGSNSFALSGAHTATGAALLENDMHLGLGVPNTWYRASLIWPETTPQNSTLPPQLHHVTGTTLPGVPFVIAGSNGHIAWGYTVAYADTGDLVMVSPSFPATLYHVPGSDDLAKIEVRHETIHVKGGPDVTVDYPWTIWGPIVGTGWKNRPLAYHWVAHDPAGLNLAIAALETATDAPAALAIAHRAGVPTLNLLVADSTGRIGWTISGQLPRRAGFDGRAATDWTYGDRGWKGFLAAEEIPTALTPATASSASPASVALANDGRLWTANNRIVGGTALTLAGDGGYMRAPRAAQGRDALAALEKAAPQDLLHVALDDRALFLARWQKLLLATLSPDALARKDTRAALRAAVEKWEGRASTDSVSYRLVRAFRLNVARRTFTPIFASCTEADPSFNWSRFNYEDPLWTLLHEKPAHLLDPQFPSWDELLLAAADDVTASLAKAKTPLAAATWGRLNTTRIRHPFSLVMPAALTSWLNLPATQLPGDADMPRMQGPDFGASERFAVSPGREAEGLFHMPGGQSGHPLSPYYRAGHEAWERGAPTPFLPGKTEHTLTLQP